MELMIVVVILGILAAVAIPAYQGYITRSKVAESYANLQNMYKLAASYYHVNFSTATSTGYCTVGSTATGWEPNQQKQQLDWEADPNFRSLKFSIADATYYVYEITSAEARCGNSAASPAVYTMRARGDLDGDNVQSTFEVSIASDPNNDLVRSPSVFIVDETE